MGARFEIRPLGLWDRPRTIERMSPACFRASWDDTIALLLREVDYLDARTVVVQVDADAADVRRDGMLRARARVGFPGVKVSFDSRHGSLTYATDAYDTWQANVRAIALGLVALRAVDRYGIGSSGEQYRGWTAISAAPAETELTKEEARRVLADAAGLQPDDLTTDDAITRAYRVAAHATHPDTGGSPDAFRLVRVARDVLIGAGANA